MQSDLQTYLNQINQTPLLSAEEERELASAIQARNCFESRERMIRANLRLVVALAKQYMNRGLPLADLIEEGNLGLVRAVENFDPDYGARFSTYAAWWIKQAIKRALINAVQPVHVPAYMVELISRWKRASQELEELLDRPPSIKELAQHMKLPPKKVRIIRSAVHAYQRPSQRMDSGDDDGFSLSDMLEDSATPAPDEPVRLEEEIAQIRQLLNAIDGREANILRLRYGLGDEPSMTLKEIGERIGLTRERVRQLELQALEKLHSRLDPEHAQRPARPARRRKQRS